MLVVPAWYGTPEDPFAGVFVREQARLVAARHDVAVVHPFAPGAPARGRLWSVDEAVEDGIPTLRVRIRRLPLPPRELPAAAAGTRAALARLRRRGWVPDVIHAHVFSAAAVARLAAGRRTPMVVTEHFSGLANGDVRGVSLRVARFAYGSAGLVAPVSRNLAERIAALGVRTPVRAIPNAVDTARFRPPAADERPAPEPERLLLVGALTPIKRVPDAIEALARLRATRPHATLELVGDGPERAACEALARRLGVGDAVRFAGRLDRDAVAARMRASHVLVSASAWENLPGNQLEALASGLPVVATAVGGVPDLIDAEVGALVPPGDPAALAAAINDVLARREAFDPVRMAARTAERFGPRRIAALWDDVYAELAAGGRRARPVRAAQRSSA